MAERTTPGATLALTIAGSDCSGGAGIAADLKTFSVMRVYGAAVITAITAQNTTGVKRSQVLDADLVDAQIDAVGGDLDIAATKTGMMGTAAVAETVADAIKRHTLSPLVVDPVMVSKNGDPLIDDDALAAMRKHLLPLATLVTPNRYEAARLIGEDKPIDNITAASGVAAKICETCGADACIITGFHRENDGDGEMVDVFFDGSQSHEVTTDRRPSKHTHGSGCTFSAAITAGLALDQSLADAISEAKQFIYEAVRQANKIGAGVSPVNHLAYLDLK